MVRSGGKVIRAAHVQKVRMLMIDDELMIR